MLRWLGRFFSSPIGMKMGMALTGLALVGFLVVHLLGNLSLFADDTGEAFNAYAHALEETQPLLLFAEIGLIALFIAHIAFAVQVARRNREARPEGYRLRASMGRKTLGSSSMLLTGLIVLVFLVVHVADFRIPRVLGSEDMQDLAGAVKARLATPLGAGIYLIGVGALGVHLSHAVKSAFQTLGVSHPKYTPVIEVLGLVLAVGLFLGFAVFPIVLFLGGGAS